MSNDSDTVPTIHVDGVGYLTCTAALLYILALLNSIKEDRPGFVSDEFLARRRECADTGEHLDDELTELVESGSWELVAGGYRAVKIPHDPDELRNMIEYTFHVLRAVAKAREN